MPDNPTHIYFIGIGGIGMSALARYYLQNNYHVAGYDKTQTPLTEKLEAEGALITYVDQVSEIPKVFTKAAKTKVIYTPAIPQDSAILNYFNKGDFNFTKRALALGNIAKNHKTLAVAGTHGKTTTSSLLAHLFRQAQIPSTAFLGGISANYQTNFWSDNEDGILVAEADEYDRSFLQLTPDTAIITSMDADHLDIYENGDSLKDTFLAFSKQVQNHLVTRADLNLPGHTYAVNTPADYSAENIHIKDHAYYFDLQLKETRITNIRSGLPGIHNVENATAAAAVAHLHSLSAEDIKAGIESFKGVRRRFEYHINRADLVYIDDYAHHPKEIEALLNSVRDLYPENDITIIFQPHLFSRTRDFMDDFASSLSLADEIILLDIYPAREKPIAGISSSALAQKIDAKKVHHLPRTEALEYLEEHKPKVTLTVGAGDIDQMINAVKITLLNG